jgi:exosortase/archaeosortase family protein
MWVRIALFVSVIPVAIFVNGSRITITGILTTVKPELAEGFFHEATGLFLFFAAFVVLILLHQLFSRIAKFFESRRAAV